MAFKKNKAGKLQAYDPRTGRYSHMSSDDFFKYINNRPKTKEQKRENRRRALYERAHQRRDPLVPEVFEAIENRFPGCVQNVNHSYFDENLGHRRELDIITSHAIVEVKSGTAKRSLKQLVGQSKYAKSVNKDYIVYAPSISTARQREYNKHGIKIARTMQELLNSLKEK